MHKTVALRLAAMAAGSLLISAAWLGPALALKCQTSSGSCYDTKTKEYRKCTTKVCTDETGTVVSTETVVEKQGVVPPKRKAPAHGAPATGGVKR